MDLNPCVFQLLLNHMKKQLIVFLTLALILTGMPISIKASTNVSGSVTSPVWTVDKSPYIVNGVLEVSQGAKLIINPGVVVRFEKNAKILIKGELQAIGEDGNAIVFTSNELAPTRSYWGGIEFADGSADANIDANGNYLSGSIIKNAVIKYSEGIVCDDASPYLTDNLILNNNIGFEIKGEGSGEGNEILLGQESNKPKIITTVIQNNEISDNNIGVLISRANGNDYIVTPAGKIYQGNKQIPVKLKNNDINNNNQGVVISQGDNNIISGNKIKHNFFEGIWLGVGSLNNVVEKNYLNNNEIGLKISANEAKVLQNEIINNSEYGIYLTTGDDVIKNNNIYNNKANLYYDAGGKADLSNNYWGINNLNQAQSGVTNEDGTADITPIKSSAININDLLAPIIDDYINLTTSSNQTVSGVKTTGTAVIINGQEAVAMDDQVVWEYNMKLIIGDNKGIIYLKDASDNTSPTATVNITREEIIVISEPTVDYEANTSRGSQVISGAKEVNTAIWINGGEVVPIDNLTTWSYNMPLAKGKNEINIYAKNSQAQRSQSISIVITRSEVDINTITEEEKNLTTSVDQKLSARLAGRLLLQVEQNGQIWYVDTNEHKRYFVTFDNALNLFRKLALGITEENLAKIPYKSGKQAGDKMLRERLKGKLLLRVQSDGQISYVDAEGFRNDINMDNLMNIFRSLSLGISNENIRKITVGEIN